MAPPDAVVAAASGAIVTAEWLTWFASNERSWAQWQSQKLVAKTDELTLEQAHALAFELCVLQSDIEYGYGTGTRYAMPDRSAVVYDGRGFTALLPPDGEPKNAEVE